jgi:transposase
MGYRAMNIEVLYSLWRRWKDGQRPAEIARQEGLHRATVYDYFRAFEALDLPADAAVETVRAALLSVVPANKKPSPAQDLLAPYLTEITDLITRDKEPLKPKSAWAVINARHGLDGRVSYETFKRFVRGMNLTVVPRATTIRIELEAGLETQVDYAKMGMKVQPGKEVRRTVHAFIGVLACSRLPFVQFVWGQSQSSFIASIIAMFTFWGGVTKRLSLDNLKAGVIKADIYDPVLNRSLSEAADHYHFFIDPCRVASPTEKGKVERMVQTVREIYRQLSTLYPEESLEKLSLRAQDWCREVYGTKVHGTIGVPPFQAFTELEKPALQPLPEVPFKLTQWGTSKVHPDQYIRFQGRFYSLPARYIGLTVQVRRDGKMIDIFLQESVIRSYILPSSHRAYLSADFPESTRGMMDGSYAAYLIRKGEAELGADVATLLKQVLDVPANQTARRALGILDRLNKHKGQPYLADVVRTAIHRRIDQPRALEILLEKAGRSIPATFITPRSELGRQMIRDIAYYIN